MSIFRQAVKEFWLPFCIALVWTCWNIFKRKNDVWSFTHCVNIFAPSFFLASWLVGQYFRIKKQSRVEDNLVELQRGVKSLLNELETKTKDVIAQVTGGDSFCYLMLGSLLADSDTGILVVIHQGRHPMFDVSARIVDVEASDRVSLEKKGFTYETFRQTDIRKELGNMIPGHCIDLGEVWNLGKNSETRRFNIFFTARSGSFTQLLRFKKVGRHWLHATKVERAGTIYENIQPGFPRNEKGGVDW